MGEIGLDTLLQRNNNLLFNEMDGEIVMFSVENSEYYGMNKVGSRIWELLVQPVSFKALLKLLMDEFEVAEDKCIHDTLFFVNMLKNKNMITCH